MEPVDVGIAGDLRVQRDDQPAGAVVVDHHVVNANDVRLLNDDLADSADQTGVGLLPQQRGDRVARSAVSGPEDDQGDQNAAPGIEVDVGELVDDHRQNDDGCSHRVRQRICGNGLHGRGLDLPPDPAIVKRHVAFDEHGPRQNEVGGETGTDDGRMDDFGNGLFQQLDTHQQDEQGDDEPGDVLGAPVAEGVVLVGGLFRLLKPDQRDDRRAGIAQVVQRVGDHGDGPGDVPGDDFPRSHQQIQKNAQAAAQPAVGGTDLWVVILISIPNEQP